MDMMSCMRSHRWQRSKHHTLANRYRHKNIEKVRKDREEWGTLKKEEREVGQISRSAQWKNMNYRSNLREVVWNTPSPLSLSFLSLCMCCLLSNIGFFVSESWSSGVFQHPRHCHCSFWWWIRSLWKNHRSNTPSHRSCLGCLFSLLLSAFQIYLYLSTFFCPAWATNSFSKHGRLSKQ